MKHLHELRVVGDVVMEPLDGNERPNVRPLRDSAQVNTRVPAHRDLGESVED